MIKQKLNLLFSNSLSKLGLPHPNEIDFEYPTNPNFGDYSTNIAMSTFSSLKENSPFSSPTDLASAIVEQINLSLPEEIKSIQVDGPGFINVHLQDTSFIKIAEKIVIQGSKYGSSDTLHSHKIVIEFTDPNPFKDFHIGHVYTNTVGESIARLKESQGATVWRADYFGDVGMHVAKSIWGLIEKLKADQLTIEKLSQKPLDQKIAYLGKAYALGASAYKDEPQAAENMRQINFIIYRAAQKLLEETMDWQPIVNYQNFVTNTSIDQEMIFKIYKLGRSWSLEYFDSIYQRLGMKFDGYYPESLVGELGFSIVEQYLGSVFKSGKNGAIIFPGSDHGLHDRVFVNSLGLPTYEAKELGLAPTKYQDFKYDQSIVITGNEINEYFKVLIKALTLVDPQLGASTVHLGHGMVRLPEGKMSSRTGKIIRGIWLLDEAKGRIEKIMGAKYSKKETGILAELIGQAAIKYAFLKHSIGEDLAFDLDTSISFEGDSGPYLQYTYARCQSVLKKNTLPHYITPSSSLNFEERQVFKLLPRFPELVTVAASVNSPHLVCAHLSSLAQNYNAFYNKHTIISSSKVRVSPETQAIRILLTRATAQVLKNGLHLLGIKTVDNM